MSTTEYMWKLANDEDFLGRLTIAAAQSGEAYPNSWAREHAVECVIAIQDPVDAYKKRLQDPYVGKPALDPTVVSDSDLMAMVVAVQEKLGKPEANTASGAPVSTPVAASTAATGDVEEPAVKQ